VIEKASDFDAIIAAGRSHREDSAKKRTRTALQISLAVVAIWLVFVTVASHWGRVLDNWASAIIMVFGSIVGGGTPQGGGAVAFPLFTKALNVDTSVARSFSLSIQAIGMTIAMVWIIVTRRAAAWRAIAVATPVAIVFFVLTVVLLGRYDEPFWPSRLPGAYVKVTFTLLLAAMAIVVYLGYRVQILERIEILSLSSGRLIAAIAIAAAFGGVASALTGSGADVIVYLAIVVIIGISPRVGVPTTVVVMALVSVVGFVLFGLIAGQLDVVLTDGLVTEVGGRAVSDSDGVAVYANGPGLEARRFDLYGMWLAAVPIVAFGAPLGSWVSSRATDRQIVRFVIGLAILETVSTVLFLDGLLFEPDPALIAYAVIGGVVVFGTLWLLRRYRRQILGLPPVDLDESFTRSRLDTGPAFRRQLGEPGDDRTPRE